MIKVRKKKSAVDRFRLSLDIEPEIEEAVDEIRRLTTPIPKKKKAVEAAILFYRDHLKSAASATKGARKS